MKVNRKSNENNLTYGDEHSLGLIGLYSTASEYITLFREFCKSNQITFKCEECTPCLFEVSVDTKRLYKVIAQSDFSCMDTGKGLQYTMHYLIGESGYSDDFKHTV